MVNRRLWKLVAAVLVAFATLAIALLFRSYLVSDAIYFSGGTDASNTRATLVTFPGRVFLEIHWRDDSRLHTSQPMANGGWGYHTISATDRPIPVPDHAFLGFGLSHSGNVQNITGYVHKVFQMECPIGAFAMISLLLATLILRRLLIVRPGHCRQCGYDLRASVDRCPECGRPISAQTSQATKSD